MTALPPLPRIDTDFELLLDVYTHRTLVQDNAMNDKWGNAERLAFLGEDTYKQALTFHLFSKRPCMDWADIESLKSQWSEQKVTAGWVDSYHLKDKLRVDPSSRATVLENVEEMDRYFKTYVGAVYYQSGMQVVQDWISGLIDPECAPPKHPQVPQGFPNSTSGQSTGQGQPYMGYQQNYQNSYGSAHDRMPPPPPNAPPPVPNSPAPSTSSAGSSLSLVTLALVNQTASQKGLTITYPATPEGPPHQPVWTVRCCINNVERGMGRGKSQKAAKEEAARQAWAAMGWGPS